MMEEIAAAGVSVNVHFIPMPMLAVFKNLGYVGGGKPPGEDVVGAHHGE